MTSGDGAFGDSVGADRVKGQAQTGCYTCAHENGFATLPPRELVGATGSRWKCGPSWKSLVVAEQG
ncbi:hypothetical protein [Streptomyces sp. NBC_01465]|uniref:hypothetical protein n=1 Tax=Streptomyces sp. NBC_01465 TaxID=2903878 RepID=UPI002E31CB11|nr:hypothetical protein [Streptomyces sp. NBC_01465]